MDGHDGATIGARLRVLRRWRGMSQAQLAGQAGLSTSFVSMVEHGHRMLDRRSHVSALATALRVSEVELTGQPYVTTDSEQDGPHATVPALRTALVSNALDDPATDRARPLEELDRVFHGFVAQLRHQSDFAALGGVLPDLLDEVHYHVAAATDEGQRAHALRLLIDMTHPAAFVCSTLGYPDLARLAAEQASAASRHLDDPTYRGVADFMRAMTSPRAGSWDRVLRVSENAVDRLESQVADDVGVQVYGMLHLTAALAAAASSYRIGEADAHLDEAVSLADRVPDGANAFGMSFNAANVGVWRVMVAAEYGDYGKAVERARGVDPSPLPADRQAQFYVEVARAFAHQRGKERQAVMTLTQAEDAAPQRTHNNLAAHETVTSLLRKTRTAGLLRELRGMASRMGIPH